MANEFPSGKFRFLAKNDAAANLASGISNVSTSLTLDNDESSKPTSLSDITYAKANFPDPDTAKQQVFTVTIEDETILLYDYNLSTGIGVVYQEDTHSYGILSAGQIGRGFQGVGETPSGATTHTADLPVLHNVDEFFVDQNQEAIVQNTTDIATKAADADVIKKDGSVAFTADQSFGGFKATLLGTPTASGDAARKAEVDAIDTGDFIRKDGTVDFTADQSMNSHKITSVTDPASAQDAATKNYIDTNFLGVATGHAERLSGTGAGTQVITHGIGRTPKLIKITAQCSYSYSVVASWGTATTISDSKCIYATGDKGATYKDNRTGYKSDEIIYCYDSDGAGFCWEAHVSAVSTTTFTLTFSITNIPSTVKFIWEVYA